MPQSALPSCGLWRPNGYAVTYTRLVKSWSLKKEMNGEGNDNDERHLSTAKPDQARP